MPQPLDIAGLTLTLLRRLLYLWVRPAVLPEKPAELGLDALRPVCYVLDERYLSNLLVLIEEARRAGLPPPRAPLALGPLRARRSFFFLARARRLTATAKERHGHSPLLVDMVQAALADPACDVQIVPVSLLWGRAPDKQDSILKALFAETWRAPGRLRQFFAVLLHGRQALLRFGAPLSLRVLLEGEPDGARAVRKLARVLRVHFRRQREIAIGPDLSHRNTQVDTLLESAAVRAQIAAEAAGKRISEAEAERRARGFALEIASDYTYGVVRAFVLFLTWLWTRLYAGVEVRNFETAARIAPGQEIVYLPCHRSHIDYLLLSYVVYQRGLTPPHIAAGANLNMPVVGPLLRRGGAFFLRRSFKGEPLYAAVFHEYLHMMIARGFPIEYFIEGGRSRSGRMLAPKAGILGMTIRSFLRGDTRPLVFVPVYLGYEKLLEGQAFLEELQGKPKRGESLLGLLGAWRLLRHRFGRVHVSFGEPLALAEFLDARRPGWRAEGDARADWVRPLINDAAGELARRINAAAVATPVSLVALALLATPKHTADAQALLRQIEHCQALLREAPPSPGAAGCDLPAAEIVSYAEGLGFVERLPHPLGELLRVRADTAALLAYFRNNVLHLFALPALLACLLGRNRRLDAQRMEAAVAGIYPLLRAELFLHCPAEALPGAMAAVVSVLAARGLLRRNPETGRYAAPEPTSQAFAELRQLGEAIRPTLERHFLTLALLQRHGPGRLTRQALEEASHLLAQRLALLYEFDAPEFSDKSLFAGFIGHLIDAGILREGEAGLLEFDERISVPAAHAELVLSADVRQTILRMAGESAPAPSAAD
ncbi:MAG: glycerol-3-phosphate 1-O-acyltransferase PlsB [Zoogloeaceae bacterium]|jgi:glycerol-3-phosphate O-acyltransferase|nr:glycerol-3-phosphate 1-O-acyltransferase PlsB [Zoogloeaceae bacterium]MCK6384684.1 glycerol-3-phosphate 1-O-acyltransferase PlsB [Rhodocyclaceae bacterium]